MDEQVEAVWKATRAKVDDLLTLAGSLEPRALNTSPGIPGANPPFVIVTHVLGNIRAWLPGIVCEEPLDRDRASEFRSEGTIADLRAAADGLFSACEAALAQLDAHGLADQIVPKQVLFGEGPTHEMTRFEALLHPLEHAALHVGQLQLTVDLLRGGDA